MILESGILSELIKPVLSGLPLLATPPPPRLLMHPRCRRRCAGHAAARTYPCARLHRQDNRRWDASVLKGARRTANYCSNSDAIHRQRSWGGGGSCCGRPLPYPVQPQIPRLFCISLSLTPLPHNHSEFPLDVSLKHTLLWPTFLKCR